MGRKNKGKQSGSKLSPSMKLMIQKVDHLLKISSKTDVQSGPKLWEDHLEIDKTVSEIRSLENDMATAETRTKNREENFPAFMDWLRENGVNLEKITIGHFETGSYGIKALQPIKESELWLSIPRNIMMTLDTGRQSPIGDFLVNDRRSSCMSQVALSLHLLDQRLDPDSFWKPYLNALPCEYETVLYFTPDELLLLKGSPSFESSLKHYCSIARQYAHFWKVLHENKPPKTDRLKKGFTYDNYRWAVSTVMTRQNEIPDSDGKHRISALIPFWDMCNHRMGTLSTDFDLEKDTLECYALEEFQPEQQVFIFYGPRSNSDFFLHNAFLVPDNSNNDLKIKLGISKNDVNYAKKCHLLDRMKIGQMNATFCVTCNSQPISDQLWAFSRIFSMTQEELDMWMSMEEDIHLLDLFQLEMITYNPDLDKRVQNFLLVRLSLLLRAYSTTLEQDENILKKDNLNNKEKMAINLRITDKKILIAATEFLKNQVIKNRETTDNNV